MIVRCVLFIVIFAFGCATTPTAHTCKSGNVQHCIDQGERLYKNRAHPQALKSFERACQAQNGYGCQWVGFMYAQGLGTRKDQERSLEIYQRACTLKNAASCNILGKSYRDAKQTDKAFEFYQQACTYKSSEGCWAHGELTRRTHGYRQSSTTKAYLQKACQFGHQTACKTLKREDATYSNRERFYYRACQRNVSSACYLLAKSTESRWYTKACQARHKASCKAIGQTPPTKPSNTPPAAPKTEIAAMLKSKAGSFQFCYERVLYFENRQATGKVVVQVTVQPNNENIVKVVQIAPSIKSMQTCMEQTIESMSFPVVNQNYMFIKTFVFSVSQ